MTCTFPGRLVLSEYLYNGKLFCLSNRLTEKEVSVVVHRAVKPIIFRLG